MTAPSKADGNTETHAVSFKFELLRKGIHLTSLSIPLIYSMIERELALAILIPLMTMFLIVDALRSWHTPTFRLYERIFGRMLRHHEKTPEKKTFNGATWVLISATFCVLVFPKLIAITAFAILIVSDTVAALVGRRYGTRMYRGKTLEGSSAFVLSAFVVVLLTPKVAGEAMEYGIAFVSAIVGALAEVASFDIIDDNFAIPVAIGFTLWVLYILFLPELNIYTMDG